MLDTAREHIRKAVAMSQYFASFRVVAEEGQALHVLTEALYALDSRHWKAGKRRVYHASDLLPAGFAYSRVNCVPEHISA